LLSDARRHIREWRRSIAAFDEGHMRLLTNHVDTSRTTRVNWSD